MNRLGVAVWVVAGAAAPWACTTDHDALAKRPSSGGSAGQAGDAGSDASAGSAGSGGSAGGALDAGKDVFVEPAGDDALTLVHGVVDAPTIAFCFARSTASGVELVGDPIPKSGLGYANAVAQASIPGIDFANDDVELFVIAAEGSVIAGGSCAALVVDPAVRAPVLALIPKATFGGGYSNLLVAGGCLGAPSHEDQLDDMVCGTGYTPQSPTLTPFVVQMSRATKPDKLGLQIVHASVANTGIDVRSLPPDESSLSPVFLAYDVVQGSIEPRPPNLSYASALYGSPISGSTIEIASSQNTSIAVGFEWGQALALGGVPSVADGRTFALILLGPRLGFAQGSWWNPPAVSVITTAPEP